MNDSLMSHGTAMPETNLPAAALAHAPVAEGVEPSLAVPAAPAEAAAQVAPAGPNGFELLGLAPELVQAVADMGYTEPTAVQNKAIPMAL
ncbi:MAG: DEAD/DEAH box helicase, partial [Burkholderiaceae bacterium]|nr:DEAD/DEAH box helicase [Burkholderiaceae bacterium]